KADFVSAVSHDLRSPLTSIRMYAEVLKETWPDESKRTTYLRYIGEESERLSRLIENVLALARLENNDWAIQVALHDPASLLQRISNKLDPIAQRADYTLEVSIEPASGNILADEDALTQILHNLVDNAIKFSGEGEKRILLRHVRDHDQSVISVRDFGPGIPPEQMGKIFDRFYRIENEMTRSTRGAGIGLAIVKLLADRMNVRLNVVNRNPGAEFLLRYPLVS
ncbi:MAG TPA: ATP-binding protein, partial [Bdellovibrionota bacterium]|nr:ATP-binding protein [Bdellovibrionota bacterium]